MFKDVDIREILEDAMEKEVSIAELKNLIMDFVKKYSAIDNFRCVFDCDEFDTMCTLLNVDTSNKSTEELFDVFEQFVSSDINNKEELVYDFVENFCECSDDEDCCENKIYIIVKNISDQDEDSIVKEYDSWEDAEHDIDDLYTGCCDDVFFAENVWFSILCSIQNREWDFVKNFCTVIEFNASGLEDSREDWENAWEAGEI